MELRGRVALVTGASGGIGRALARALVDQGMRVALSDREEKELRVAADEIGGDTAVFAIDLAAEGAADALIDEVGARFGSVDVVMNNAGLMVVGGFDEIDVPKVRTMVRVNVEAAFALGFAAMRRFKAQGSGYLVNTSSVAGVKSGPRTGAYSGTKAAIEAFTEGLRLEAAGTGIGVACIEPGTVETGLFDGMSEEDKGALKRGELLRPEDIADAAVFILTRPGRVRVPRILIVPASQAF